MAEVRVKIGANATVEIEAHPGEAAIVVPIVVATIVEMTEMMTIDQRPSAPFMRCSSDLIPPLHPSFQILSRGAGKKAASNSQSRS